MSIRARAKAELLLLSCAIIWGGTFVVVKSGLESASPFLFIAIRFAIAALLFLPFAYSSIKNLDSSAFLKGSALGFLLFAGLAAQTIGLQFTSASQSGFVTGLLVVFTPVFQLLIERRPLKMGNVIGVVLVVIGLYLLTSPKGTEFNIGDALTLLCAAVFGLYIVYLDIFAKAIDTMQLSFMQFTVTGVLSGICSMFEPRHFEPSTNLILGLAYLALLATLYTLTIQTHYQKYTTPTRAAIIFSVEPVFAAVFAYLVLGDRIGEYGILGGAIIVGGLLVSQLSDALFGLRCPPAEPS